MKNRDDNYVRICVGLIIAIGLAIVYTSSDHYAEQQVPQQDPVRKHREADACKPVPCTEPPAACFLHGGAPTAPECLRD
jgi:hypothetical protein